MASQVTLKALGLNYSPNNLALPEGSLLVANDVIVRRDNVVESRRGYKDYSEGLGLTTEPVKQLFEYKERILAHYADKIAYDTLEKNAAGQNIFNDFPGFFFETEAGLRIKSIVANKNLYFTSSEGIKKISAQSAEDFPNTEIVNAGAVKALDLTVNLDIEQGQLTGFLPPDSAVAYRVLWGYKDANENIIYGTPSERTLVYNYLTDIIPMDFNTLLNSIDNLNQSGSMITDGNYYSTYKLAITDSGETFKTNVLGLAEKLDNDILYADLNAVPANAPLTIDSLQVNIGSIGQVNFAPTQDPTTYIQENDYIQISGFTSEPVTTAVALTHVGGTTLVPENPVTITTNPNSLVNGRDISITGTTTIQSINGTYAATVDEKIITQTSGGGVIPSTIVTSGDTPQASVNGLTAGASANITISAGDASTTYSITNIANVSYSGSLGVAGSTSPYPYLVTIPSSVNLVNNDQIELSNVTGGPGDGVFYVKSVSVGAFTTTFQISLTAGGASLTTTSGTYTDPSINILTPFTVFTTSINHNISTSQIVDISGSNFTYGTSSTTVNGNTTIDSATAGTNTFTVKYTGLLNSNPSPVYGIMAELLKFTITSAPTATLLNNALIKIVNVESTPPLFSDFTVDNSISLYISSLSGSGIGQTFYVSTTSGGPKLATIDADYITGTFATVYQNIQVSTTTTHNFTNGKLVEFTNLVSTPTGVLNGKSYKVYNTASTTFQILPEVSGVAYVSGGILKECIQFQSSAPHGLSNGDAVYIADQITYVNISNIAPATPNTTITTSTPHGLPVGTSTVIFSGITQTGGTILSGSLVVTNTGANTLTVATASTPTGLSYSGATIGIPAFQSTPIVGGKYYVQNSDATTFYISFLDTLPINLVTTTSVSNTPTIFKRMLIQTSNAHDFIEDNWITIYNADVPEGINYPWQIEKIMSATEFTILPTSSTTYTPTSGIDVGNVNRVTIPVYVDTVTVGTGTVKSTVGKNLTLFNGNFQITSVVAPTVTDKGYIQFIIPNNPDTFIATAPDPIKDASAKIVSYDYRNIVNSPDIYYSTPLNELEISPIPTSEQLKIIENNISRIATKLKAENPGVIPAILIQKYLQDYSVTLFANTKLEITVPDGINENYFYQVYRTRVFTAEGVQTLGSIGDVPVVPDDEMRLVYEAFPPFPYPTTIEVEDTYPEDLALTNENLYTNPLTGSGILQANDTPPLAKDINVFKNSVFYANTKTRQRLNPFELIGTSNIGGLNNNKLTIGDVNNSITYQFVLGVQQEIDITLANSASTIKTDIQDKYVTVSTPVNDYYLWFKYDGAGTDPAPANQKQIVVNLLTGDDANTVANKINNSMGAEAIDFVSSVATNVVTVINFDEGICSAPVNNTTGTSLTVAVTQVGDGENPNANLLDISSIAPSATYTAITTVTQHGLNVGDVVVITGVSQNDGTSINGTYTVFSTPAPTPLYTFTIPTPDLPVGVTFVSAKVTVKKLFPKVLLSQVDSRSQAIDITARSLVQVINKQPSSSVYAYYISGEESSPGIINLEAKILTSPQFYVLASGTQMGESFTPDISPDKTATSIVSGGGNVYEITSTNHGLNNQDKIIISGSNCTPNIDGIYPVTKISANVFSVLGLDNLTVAGTYLAYSKLSNAAVSTNEEKQNRVYYSKTSEPEAVPILNFFDIGSSDKAILRIFPLRDSLFVFKEDGLYRISGEEIPFVVGLFDSSCVVAAPDSVSISNNVIYAWTVKGVSNITESGVAEISRPIDTEILKLASSRYTNFKTATWGIGYDSDNSYTVYTTAQSADEFATIGFRYSDLTSTWTNVNRSQNCGIVLSSDNKIYTAGSEDNIIYQERKNFDRTDYADSDFNLQVNNGSISNSTGKPAGTRIYFQQSINNISEGDVITQEQILTQYTFNSLLEKLDLDPTVGVKNISSTSGAGSTITVTTVGNHNLVNDNYVNITGTNSTPSLDGQYKIFNTTLNTFDITITNTLITQATVGKVKRNYANTLKMTTGDSLRNKMLDLTAYLDTDPGLNYTNYLNRILNYSGSILSNSADSPTIITSSIAINISSIVPATPATSIVTSTNHGLVNGDTVYIQGVTQSSGTTINGYQVVTVTSPNSFTIATTVLPVVTSFVGSKVNVPVPHNLVNGRIVTITEIVNGVDNGSIPSLTNKTLPVTILNTTQFTVPVSVTTEGELGLQFETSSNDLNVLDVKACYNSIIANLNSDTGTTFKNYKLVDDYSLLESVIIGVNYINKFIDLNLPLPWTDGLVTIYKSIPCEIVYAPITFGDPLSIKQIYEATMMFDNKAFTKATASFNTDLKPQFMSVDFYGQGNGIFGHYSDPGFGYGFFGGLSNSAPFRTIIPRESQRCRFLTVKFEHDTGREKWALNGITLTGNVGLSSRGYR